MIVRSLERLFAIFLIAVLLFVVPTYYQYQRQEEMNYQLVLLETEKAADLVCELGYIEEHSLAKLQAVLAATGTNYQIRLSHLKKEFLENEGEGKIEAYYVGSYNTEIYQGIRSEGKYRMNLGDFFYISVENTSQTPFQQLKSFLGVGGQRVSIIARGGGLIRAEGL
ncbi:MAG: hypothetical protein Q4A29_08900 [Eubacteriales bacterium]|nr:hypothetical protein [Eubacteriales bacterium]